MEFRFAADERRARRVNHERNMERLPFWDVRNDTRALAVALAALFRLFIYLFFCCRMNYNHVQLLEAASAVRLLHLRCVQT